MPVEVGSIPFLEISSAGILPAGCHLWEQDVSTTNIFANLGCALEV